MSEPGTLTLLGVGDVRPRVGPMDRHAELAQAELQAADIRVAQCEGTYSVRGSLQRYAGTATSHLPPEHASIFKICNFDVVSLASNHALDYGDDAFLDTLDLFADMGIAVVGAGRTLEEARQPVVVERNGVKVAILANCSVLREGYEATDKRPGVNPLRAHTYYEPYEYQPGTPPKVITVPFREDLARMVEDIENAKRIADAVVLWPHWGIHHIPRVIADYQVTIAETAFQAGADVIIGGHPHIAKAVTTFGDRVCFYSMGNFLMAGPNKNNARVLKHYGVEKGSDPTSPYSADGKWGLVAKLVISSSGLDSVAFRPVLIDSLSRPEFLYPGDPRFDEAIRFVEWISEDYPHRFEVGPDGAVVVRGAN